MSASRRNAVSTTTRTSARHPRRLLLVGGGHAHVEVLRRLALERPPGIRATLVSPLPVHLYSGMLTGYVAGEYALEELTFPLESLATRAGAELVRGEVARVDAVGRVVTLADGRRLAYHAVSFDVGSTVRGIELPGVRDHALTVKPLDRIAELPRALDHSRPGGTRLLVVGGGAAGVELALTSAARLARRGGRGEVRLVEAGAELLGELGRGAGWLARRLLRARGVTAELGTSIVAVEEGVARSAAGTTHPFDVLVWASGPASQPLFADSGLATDADGYLRVGRSLEAREHPGVFGAGDCVALEGAPWMAKTGVYAVREAPVLWRSLRASLTGAPAPVYRPQRRFLWAINTGDGRALLGWGPFRCHGRWARRLKHRIDVRFMRRYRALPESGGAGAGRCIGGRGGRGDRAGEPDRRAAGAGGG